MLVRGTPLIPPIRSDMTLAMVRQYIAMILCFNPLCIDENKELNPNFR